MTRLAVDIGGTFTDIAFRVGPRLITAKVPTTAKAPQDCVMHGIRQVLAAARRTPRGSTAAAISSSTGMTGRVLPAG